MKEISTLDKIVSTAITDHKTNAASLALLYPSATWQKWYDHGAQLANTTDVQDARYIGEELREFYRRGIYG